MDMKEKIKYKIDNEIVKNYIIAINSIKEPMNQVKKQLNNQSMYNLSKILNNSLKSINNMSNIIKNFSLKYPNNQAKIYIDVIKQIMNANNGMLTTRMIEPLNISRQYLSIMKNNNDIEKISRGIYTLPNVFEDSYYSFQQKYKKAIFSHMNALYFYDLTEEYPYNYTVTVPQNYHVNAVNEKCNVFYVSDDIYELGITEVCTSNGNKVRTYDKERSICDIIKSKGRMDPEQVRKTIKKYIKSKDKNLIKLSKYAKKMGISKKVAEIMEAYYK